MACLIASVAFSVLMVALAVSPDTVTCVGVVVVAEPDVPEVVTDDWSVGAPGYLLASGSLVQSVVYYIRIVSPLFTL